MRFFGFTTSTDDLIQTFIQENIKSIRLQYQSKIKLVECDYREHMLAHQFRRQNPNERKVNSYALIFKMSHLSLVTFSERNNRTSF